jgi:hypothetical protein
MGRNIFTGVAPEPPVKLPNIDVNSNVSIDSNKAYWVDTTSGTISLTLPATAAMGDQIRIFDVSNTFDTNSCTVIRNGNLIMGAADDLTINTEGAAFELVYYNVAKGWRIFTI